MKVRFPEGEHRGRAPIDATITIANEGDAPRENVTAEVGLPPGVDVDAHRVRAEMAGVAEVERHRDRLVLYFDRLAPAERRVFRVPLAPRHVLDALTAPSRVYAYYAPELGADVAPVRLRVER